jgi:MYXO-CTERM domain-containing protein
MGRGLSKIAWGLGIAGAIGAVGCVIENDEETAALPGEVVSGSDPQAVLKSTLVLEGGCLAAKVGPRHLLVSARCVAGSEALAEGSTLHFRSAIQGSEGPTLAAEPAAGEDEGAPKKDDPSDAGAADAAGGAGRPVPPGSREATVAEIHTHSSYAVRCVEDACGLASLRASDAADVALIVLEDELTTVPTVPVDLDPVGEADPLLAVNAGCDRLDADPTGLTATRTVAVPSRAANHEGSPYKASPQHTTRLAASYVVTAGQGWRDEAPGLCQTDLGAPLFRAGVAAVAGVTANLTAWDDVALLPVTVHHTRIDARSRFKIGAWLEDLGAETIHSCSEMAGGCPKRSYDGGVPKGGSEGGSGEVDGGDPGTPDEDGGDPGTPESPDTRTPDEEEGGSATPPDDRKPSGPREEPLPPSNDNDYYGDDGYDYGDAAVPRTKKKAAEGGCSAAPGPLPAGELSLSLGVLGLALALRRRRESKKGR